MAVLSRTILPTRLFVFLLLFVSGSADGESKPLVSLAVLARNAGYLLPNYFGYIENLKYPKERIAVRIYTDHNQDNTAAILQEWATAVQSLYHSVSIDEDTEWLYSSQHPFEWHEERFIRICKLRQRALNDARTSGADYILFVDTDNFLVNSDVLNQLLEQKKPIVAPMLRVAGKEKTYSNFWYGQDENGYYKRTPEYFPTLDRKKIGCFRVPLVHSTMLIDLQTAASSQLSFWPAPASYDGPLDDIIMFAYSARISKLGMFVLNKEIYGSLVLPKAYSSLEEARMEFFNFKLATLVNHPPVQQSQYIATPAKTLSNAGVDAIYMISLVRRQDRRQRMLACLSELALNYTVRDAVDGRNLNESYLQELGIHYMPGWRDPWGERPLTYGEVGCFLSHYFIWLKVIDEKLDQVLVLEDDVDFQPNFEQDLGVVLKEVEKIDPDWDLLYVGRKPLNWKKEQQVANAPHLVHPLYSYWTLGYALSLRGAKKLVEGRPFDNLLPVDEYIPIMYNQHPEESWAEHFTNRNLKAYSASPLLAYPTHYVGDEGWFSDTEPPVEVLNEIRARKIKEEEEEQQKLLQQQQQQTEKVEL